MIEQVIRFMVRQIQSRNGSAAQRIRPSIQPGGEILLFSSVLRIIVGM